MLHQRVHSSGSAQPPGPPGPMALGFGVGWVGWSPASALQGRVPPVDAQEQKKDIILLLSLTKVGSGPHQTALSGAKPGS
jgi:hypothetical protein